MSSLTFCTTIKSSSLYDKQKIAITRFSKYYHLFAPRHTTWHCCYPIDPKVRTKMAGIVNKVYSSCNQLLTYHFAFVTKYISAVSYCHDSCTVLSVDGNGTIAVNPCNSNSVYAVDVAIKSTTVFDNESSISSSKHKNWTQTSASLKDFEDWCLFYCLLIVDKN